MSQNITISRTCWQLTGKPFKRFRIDVHNMKERERESILKTWCDGSWDLSQHIVVEHGGGSTKRGLVTRLLVTFEPKIDNNTAINIR